MRFERASRWFIALAAVALHAPILRAGFVSDDYVLLAAIERRSPVGNGPWNLWSFHDGIPEHTRALIHGGGLPWWTEPTARHAFFRPLSSALLAFAHPLFAHRAALYHALSLLAFAASLLLAGAVYERLLSRRAAPIALAFFAVHALHVWPVQWLSAIHIPLSSALGFLAVHAHVRYREDGWAPGRIVSCLSLAFALAAGEAGLTAVPYLFLAEFLGENRKAPIGRVLAPQLVVVAGWGALYRAAGFGSRGIDGYLDPSNGFWRFSRTLAGRALEQWPRLFTAGAEGLAAEWGSVVVLVTGGALVVGVVLSGIRVASRHILVTWTVAALLAALPGLLGPTDRALYGATFGAAAVLGWVTLSSLDRMRNLEPSSAIVRALAALVVLVLVGTQGFAGAAVTLESASATAALWEEQRRGIAALGLPNPAATDVVVLVADDQTSGPWGGVVHAWTSGVPVRSWQALSLTDGPHRLARVDAVTFELEPYAPTGFDPRIYRDVKNHPLHVGDRFETPHLVIEVRATDGARATRIRVVADRTLDDPGFSWATRAEGRLERARMPSVGESSVLL